MDENGLLYGRCIIKESVLLNSNVKKLDFLIFSKGLFQLMKPRVMSLVIFTCVVGLLIAPTQISLFNSSMSLLAVALGAGAAGTLNMWYESDLDALMERTCLRPIPSGIITKNQALIFGISTSIISIITLFLFSNITAAIILGITILFYVIIYTIWLKRKTPQNIVIGGAAGALPPVIGWSIATGSIGIEPIILFLIIFFWTPSHFWALSLYRSDDYKKANIPMLPLISGIDITKLNILIYSIIYTLIVLSPFFFGFYGLTYFTVSVVISSYYVYLCFKLFKEKITKNELVLSKKIFGFSIFHLFLIFILILIDSTVI